MKTFFKDIERLTRSTNDPSAKDCTPNICKEGTGKECNPDYCSPDCSPGDTCGPDKCPKKPEEGCFPDGCYPDCNPHDHCIPSGNCVPVNDSLNVVTTHCIPNGDCPPINDYKPKDQQNDQNILEKINSTCSPNCSPGNSGCVPNVDYSSDKPKP